MAIFSEVLGNPTASPILDGDRGLGGSITFTKSAILNRYFYIFLHYWYRVAWVNLLFAAQGIVILWCNFHSVPANWHQVQILVSALLAVGVTNTIS